MMSPVGWRHGYIIGNLHGILAAHISKHDLGVLFGAETGFRLASDPDTVLAPDIAFIQQQNLPERMPDDAYWPGAPDLVVEVLSPGDRTGEVDDKIAQWLTSGAHAVWVIDPKLRLVTIHQPGKPAQIRSVGEDLQGDPVVAGFSCPVAELFQ